MILNFYNDIFRMRGKKMCTFLRHTFRSIFKIIRTILYLMDVLGPSFRRHLNIFRMSFEGFTTWINIDIIKYSIINISSPTDRYIAIGASYAIIRLRAKPPSVSLKAQSRFSRVSVADREAARVRSRGVATLCGDRVSMRESSQHDRSVSGSWSRYPR